MSVAVVVVYAMLKFFSSWIALGFFLYTLDCAISFRNNVGPPPILQILNTRHQHGPPQRRIRFQTSLDGIPKLFKWMLDLYPITVESLKDENHAKSMHIDNFYLDMNGIIHQCTHANSDGLVHLNEQQMFLRIFKYTDQLYKMIKPKNLLYLAIDGVAPRAKMNQQRGRRFRAAKDRELLIRQESDCSQSVAVPSFDSNCITPGTDFMQRLAVAFQLWIEYQIENDPFWKNGATIIFSGPDVPGEGEHKIMDKIRTDQRDEMGKSEKTLRHCMYGLDADLIMLSLVTHEKNFVLLRETMNARREQIRSVAAQDFEVLEVSTLRKMLKLHFQESIQRAMSLLESKPPTLEFFPLNMERVLDDFVFMYVMFLHLSITCFM